MAGEGLNRKEMGPSGLGFRVLSPVEKTKIINEGYGGGVKKISTIGYSTLGTALSFSEAWKMCEELNSQLKSSNNPKLRMMEAKIIEDKPNLQK